MSKDQIREVCESFLFDWNRHEWMQENGEWSDGGDCIEEGTIDPNDVESEAEDLGVGASWQGWDCREGWSAYQVGEALYVNWWRTPYGGTNRHQRDLWVCVDKSFFEAEVEAEAEEEGEEA
jgi:hypothetical protein